MKFYAYLSLLYFIDLSSRMLVRNRDWCGSRTVAKKGLWKTFLAIYSFITVQYRNPMDMTPIILGTCWLSRTTTTILEGCHLLDRMEKCMVKARYLEGPNSGLHMKRKHQKILNIYIRLETFKSCDE